MKTKLYLTLALTAVFLFQGCAEHRHYHHQHEKINPMEPYAWYPPSERELGLRKARQIELDAIAGLIQRIHLIRELELREQVLGRRVAEQTKRLDNFKTDSIEGLEKDTARREKLENDIAQLMAALAKLEAEWPREEAVEKLPELGFSRQDYLNAFRLFRDRKYAASAQAFSHMLERNPPPSLRDNILFGLSSAHYKLRRYSQAATGFNQIISGYKRSEKWFVSQIMLAMIRNLQGSKSQAVYILDEVQRKNPPSTIQSLINHVRSVIHKGKSHGSG